MKWILGDRCYDKWSWQTEPEKWVFGERGGTKGNLKRVGRSGVAATPFTGSFYVLLRLHSRRAGPETNVFRALNLHVSEGAEYVNKTCAATTELPRPHIRHSHIRGLNKSMSPCGMCALSCTLACTSSRHLKHGDQRLISRSGSPAAGSTHNCTSTIVIYMNPTPQTLRLRVFQRNFYTCCAVAATTSSPSL